MKIIRTERRGASMRPGAGPVLCSSRRLTLPLKVVSIEPSSAGPQLVRGVPKSKVIGRKGRLALARRRAVDGAFLGIALGTAVLLWWSAL